ncbi:hypothetical protein BD310DRAFT_921965 [Dichomitus squalens]|uniref:Uncharacterized protein n=1 Tax=Dichomitus squalens TaxID=114155 RepID=A0A4V2K8R8_9APHY|nr:hypothetical protein BD310DRAFT_921965 [Dichomitus squalens]
MAPTPDAIGESWPPHAPDSGPCHRVQLKKAHARLLSKALECLSRPPLPLHECCAMLAMCWRHCVVFSVIAHPGLLGTNNACQDEAAW